LGVRKSAINLAILAILCAAFVLGMRFAFPLPKLGAGNANEPASAARQIETELGKRLGPAIAAHPGTSGIATLERGADAFAARIHLARAATASIDAQYYIWDDDLTGIRLLKELQDAANRGVHVRLLVDDNGTPALDQELAALDALTTAEVRIFNPFTLRSNRLVNYAFDFFRLNRRMHNKSFTVDGVVTIVGGRNIGDIYFETGGALNYIDLDVLAVGPVAQDVGADFNRYCLIALAPDALGRLDKRDLQLRDTAQGQNYSKYVHDSQFAADLMAMAVPLEWVPTLLFSDDPRKALAQDESDDLLIRRLFAEIGTPDQSLDLISAYFVPGTSATAKFIDFAAAGVRVRVLTNALEATDVVVVQGGYSAYRGDLIDGGVEVYELRSEAGDRRTISELGLFDFSKSAIHAKSFSIDRRRAFIGSLNFDPRSKRLNTEMGLLIDSRTIAGGISDRLDQTLQGAAYQVGRSDDGSLIWTSHNRDGTVTRYDSEPNTTLPLRLFVGFISVLPIQWLL
jgi:cardiolipin synthase C